MATFTLPVAMHISTTDLNIPAGATVVVDDYGEYAGYITDDGTIVTHRGQEGAFMELDQAQSNIEIVNADAAPAETPPATPAAVAHAEETGVDLTQLEGSGADGKIVKADVAAAAEAQASDGEAQ